MYADANLSIFAARNGKAFAERLCAYLQRPLSSNEVHVFSEGTSFVRFNESVRDRHVYLVSPIALSPNDEMMELLFWLDAFRRSSALSVTVVMPYFAYAKGDKKDEPRVSVRARVCADCIELCGAERIMVMDLHAPQIVGFFTKSMDHLYALPMLCEAFKGMGVSMQNTVVVSPDSGHAKQARRFGSYLGLPVAIGDKTRHDHSERAEVLEIIGEVAGTDALIVDDFSISGGTLVELSRFLKAQGARRIYAMLSHNIVSEQGARRLQESPLEFILSTDTVDNPHIRGMSKFKTISVAPLFAECIIRYHDYRSVSPLFTSVPEELMPYTRLT